ncbi:MAG: acyl-CoA/acyl-ACP dehydrogenase [Actinomycetota bacterium]|nr:acyl-CoA/acyl-ACP dehydrogenase [Actinomycetota bacterium]
MSGANVAVLASPAEALEAAQRLAPGLAARAARHDADGEFPSQDFAELRDAGLLGLFVPRRLGGPGASFSDYAAVALELGRAAGPTALVYNMHASVTGALASTPDALIQALGGSNRALQERDRLLAAARDGSLFAVAMSERGVGARLSKLKTTYTREGEGFVLRGEKSFVSGAGHVDAYLVAARAAARDEPVVSYFFVPAGDGVRVEPSWDSLGMRATASHDVTFDVGLPLDALLGGVEGLALLLAQVMPQWLVASYAAVYVGVATAALEEAARQATARGLGRLPALRARLGRADAQIAAARLCVLDAARAVDASPGTPATNRAVWRAKLLAGDVAATVASSMLEAIGASASRRGNALERLYRDARCGALQPATSDVCADYLGLAALGADPSAGADEARW